MFQLLGIPVGYERGLIRERAKGTQQSLNSNSKKAQGSSIKVWSPAKGLRAPSIMLPTSRCEKGLFIGVLEHKVHQSARDGRVRGATKAEAEWLIPNPIGVVPGGMAL